MKEWLSFQQMVLEQLDIQKQKKKKKVSWATPHTFYKS